MTEEQQAEFNRRRRAYHAACQQYEIEKVSLAAARDRHDAAFRALNDTSAEFHAFCDEIAREGAA